MKQFNKTKTFNQLFLAIICLINACQFVPNTGNSGRKKTDSAEASGPPPGPSLGNLNFIESKGIQFSSTFTTAGDFNDVFNLRGEEIKDYLAISANQSSVLCLVAHFPTSSSNKLLILSASPASFSQFQEDYFLINSLDSLLNQFVCNQPALLAKLATLFGAATAGYLIEDVCPACGGGLLSEQLMLFDSGGNSIPNILLNNLKISLVQGGSSGGGFCSSSSQCQGLGFDCCIDFQCAIDHAIRSGVDTSTAQFQSAFAEVNADPTKFGDYPQFFYLCPVDPTNTPTPTATPDPQATAQALLTELGELKDCTDTTTNEQATCTLNFLNGSDYFALPVTTLADDLNFTVIHDESATVGSLDPNNVTFVSYAGETLFENLALVIAGSVTIDVATQNDNLSDTQNVTLTKTPSVTAPDDTLKIKYKIDGSCEQVSATLATCIKYYVQGQADVLDAKIDDHSTAAGFDANRFALPFYADITKIVKVEVDGIPRFQGSEWNLVPGAVNTVQFDPTITVFNGQSVVITYFVDLAANPVMISKLDAQTKINNYCGCAADDACRLQEVLSGSQVVDFACFYPAPDVPAPPLATTVFVNSKSIPHRFFTSGDGSPKDEPSLADVTLGQEGNLFEYTGGDLLDPNNQGNYIGFNEIYGNISVLPGTPRAPTVVTLELNKTYDLFVDAGVFSSCSTCGNDYYALVAKIFPDNFLFKGGGYFPDSSKTDRFSSDFFVGGNFRSDDLLFGRACFVPTTMIPWTHDSRSSIQNQRSARLDAQHFLTANGYNRDWYGFDYGSVIGSFNGINWFSIGNARKVKATSNKLFIAVNAYFADLTSENTFTITILENFAGNTTTTNINSDFESDGAECQQSHVCTTDSDCISQLGWDYSCQDIGVIQSNWPIFDGNGSEVPGAEVSLALTNILVGFEGPAKRCVYRGRGAPCHQDYPTVATTDSYAGTTRFGINACNQNSYCQSVRDSGGLPTSLFNTKVSRYGKSPTEQNISLKVTEADQDTFGLAARLLLRPLRYDGSDVTPNGILTNFDNNKITGLCLPGRDPNLLNVFEQHLTEPIASAKGDRVSNIGQTYTGNTADLSYLSSCSILNSAGNYVHSDSANDPFNTLLLDDLADEGARQAFSTNSLSVFDAFSGVDLIQSFGGANIVTVPGHQEDRCMRTPGSVCFTDLDCGPSKFVRDKINSISFGQSTFQDFELSFWKENLVCGQKAAKTSSDFDPTLNVCCRETNNSITIATNFNSDTTDLFTSTNNTLITSKVPGVATGVVPEVDLDNAFRYSRVSTGWDLTYPVNTTYPHLLAPQVNACGIAPNNGVFSCSFTDTNVPDTFQWKTLDLYAKRTCCTGNWIRNFSQENGGGHQWLPSKMQNHTKSSLQCMNFSVDLVPPPADNNPPVAFTCNDPDPSVCFARNIPLTEANRVMDFLSLFELTGIPQVFIQSDDIGWDSVTGATAICAVHPTDGGSNLVTRRVIPETILDQGIVANATTDQAELQEVPAAASSATSRTKYGAYDMTNFDSGKKQVFDTTNLSCCIPSGETVDASVTDNQCCTGLKFQNRCCLPDFTDVSVYLNRYVSSEANDLPDTLFDPETGYINNIGTIAQVALQNGLCCSGTVAQGVLYSPLKIPGLPLDTTLVNRFVTSNADEDNVNGAADLVNFGQRWNTHIYCVPAGN